MIVGWASWRGGGATTAALVMATRLAAESTGEPVWLVEADPAGGVLAARLGVPASSGGLEQLAFPPTDTAHLPPERRFASAAAVSGALHLVVAPGDGFRAWSCHTPRSPWAGTLRHLAGDVVVDVGRLRGDTPAAAVLDELDVLLVVTDDDVVSTASALDWITARGRVCPTAAGLANDAAWLVLAEHPGSPEPVPAAERSDPEFVRVVGRLPWVPRSAAAVNRGVVPSRRHRSGDPLVVAIDHLVATCRRLQQADAAPAASSSSERAAT